MDTSGSKELRIRWGPAFPRDWAVLGASSGPLWSTRNIWRESTLCYMAAAMRPLATCYFILTLRWSAALPCASLLLHTTTTSVDKVNCSQYKYETFHRISHKRRKCRKNYTYPPYRAYLKVIIFKFCIKNEFKDSGFAISVWTGAPRVNVNCVAVRNVK